MLFLELIIIQEHAASIGLDAWYEIIVVHLLDKQKDNDRKR